MASLSTTTTAKKDNSKHGSDDVVKIAFLTSGGDAPGMNAAIRSIVRMSLFKGCKAFAIYEGLRGLMMGGPQMIREYDWNTVNQIIGEGGTVIKSSRCPEWREEKARRSGVFNLVRLGISRLIVIGGDGSLTGANLFREEWPRHLQSLVESGRIDASLAQKHANLRLVGLVGSIDNDMVGTEITIGADTSLHRIIEAIDSIHSTAASHQRVFVVEVMGRHCGWLALNAAISAGADWLLIPEDPPSEGWEVMMANSVRTHRAMGKTVSIVIVAEGAVDASNTPIQSEHVKKILQSNGFDARVTCLGHVQRGGKPSAFDRYLATMQGIKAVEAITEKYFSDDANSSASSNSQKDFPAILVGINENKMTCKPLMHCVHQTQSVEAAMKELDFPRALSLRDPDFRANLSLWKMMHHGGDVYCAENIVKNKDRQNNGGLDNQHSTKNDGPSINNIDGNDAGAGLMRVGILNCGAPSAGMNAALWAINLYALFKKHTVISIFDGFDGLIKYHSCTDEALADAELSDMNNRAAVKGKACARVLKPSELMGMVGKGGAYLGTNRTLPSKALDAVVGAMEKLGLHALVVVGGFEGFVAIEQLRKASQTYTRLKSLALTLIPATISNNVPGTEWSLGSDTALNVIMQSCDYIKQSADSSRKRTFVVDVHGGHCGFLAVMATLSAGGTRALIHEEGIRLSDLQRDARHLIARFADEERQGRLIIRNELSSKTYTAELTSKILEEEGGGAFDSRWIVLGHLQQGGCPSPIDRVRAVRMATLTMLKIEEFVMMADPGVGDSDTTSIIKGDQGEEETFACDDLAESLENNARSQFEMLSLSDGSALSTTDETTDLPPLDDTTNANNALENNYSSDVTTTTTATSYSKAFTTDANSVVIGVKGARLKFTCTSTLMEQADLKFRRPIHQWWMNLQKYSQILAKYPPSPLHHDQDLAQK